jgi:hypothetical protein
MARVSYARRGKLERISLEALIRMIEAMRYPVEIRVLPQRHYGAGLMQRRSERRAE